MDTIISLTDYVKTRLKSKLNIDISNFTTELEKKNSFTYISVTLTFPEETVKQFGTSHIHTCIEDTSQFPLIVKVDETVFSILSCLSIFLVTRSINPKLVLTFSATHV